MENEERIEALEARIEELEALADELGLTEKLRQRRLREKHSAERRELTGKSRKTPVEARREGYESRRLIAEAGS